MVGIDILKVGDVVKWAEITDVTGDKWWVENAAVTIVNNKIIMFSVRGGGNIYTLDNDTERYEDTYVCEISYERCQDEITWSK